MWADGKWSPKESQSILWWVFPLMVRRRRYGSLTCDRNTNPPPPPTPCEWLLMRGSCQRRGLPRGRGGRSLRIRPMKLFYESGVEDVFWRDPGLLLRSVHPPSQPNTGVLYTGAGNRAVFELGMPPRRQPWWVGDYGPRLPPLALLSDHQQVSAETHEMWEKYGN